MTLPTGTISLSQVNTELCDPSTTTISLNDTDVRTLAQVPAGTISMDDLRGKFSALNLTGGTVFTPGDGYKYHVFTSTGPLTGDCVGGIVEYMAIGGGGGGGGSQSPAPIFSGNREGGGGGAGGYLTGAAIVPGSLSTTVTIGGGGSGGPGPGATQGSTGSDTTIPALSITAGGGGGGGRGCNSPTASSPGLSVPLGSGGGGGYPGGTGGSGGPQGNLGSPGNPSNGGGGGGSEQQSYSADGGVGSYAPPIFTPIPSVRPAGYTGGGGGAQSGSGRNGGGDGGPSGVSATGNTGSGGGGAGLTGNSGGNGGSGFFILRYPVSPGASGISGGTEFTPGDGYKYCVFTGSGTFLVNGSTTSVEYIVVGGGGQGSYNRSPKPTIWARFPSGGGGGGGFRTGTIPLPVGGYTVTIGSGGSRSSSLEYSGDPSSFHTITSAGGGGGGGNFQPTFADGATGGSGGGGAVKIVNPYGPARIGVGGTGNSPPTTPAQGYPGGAHAQSFPLPSLPTAPVGLLSAGGGGGANAAGKDVISNGAPGGDGGEGGRVTWDIPTGYGTPGPNPGRYFAGGGGGGEGTDPVGGAGGIGFGAAGGGGDGGPVADAPQAARGDSYVSGEDGTTNTGGGGGGAPYIQPSGPGPGAIARYGGNGGSGIVILRALE